MDTRTVYFTMDPAEDNYVYVWGQEPELCEDNYKDPVSEYENITHFWSGKAGEICDFEMCAVGLKSLLGIDLSPGEMIVVDIRIPDHSYECTYVEDSSGN